VSPGIVPYLRQMQLIPFVGMGNVRLLGGAALAATLLQPSKVSGQSQISLDLHARPTDSAVYHDLVRRAKAGEEVDYAAMRFLFARLPAPRTIVDADTLLAHARRAPTHAAARAALDSVLDDYYGSSLAHEIAMSVLYARGDTMGVRAETLVYARFFQSMTRGDTATAGMTVDDAIDVVAVAEEYLYLRGRFFERSGMQATRSCPGGECDEVQVRDKRSGKTFPMYFRWTRTADRSGAP
jgi:hypothetical protein